MKVPLVEWGVATKALPGETESGDRHLIKVFPHGALAAVVDGLGHGEEAAWAATTATDVLRSSASESLIGLVQRCHERMRSARGVVMSVATFNELDGTMTWLGVGNVEGILLRAASHVSPSHESLLVRNGVVGVRLPALQASIVPVMKGDTMILATDGIRREFVKDVPITAPPQQIADRILATYAKGTDDALVLVVRYLGGTR